MTAALKRICTRRDRGGKLISRKSRLGTHTAMTAMIRLRPTARPMTLKDGVIDAGQGKDQGQGHDADEHRYDADGQRLDQGGEALHHV